MRLSIILVPIIEAVFLPEYYPIDRHQGLHSLFLSLLLVVPGLLEVICACFKPLVDQLFIRLCLGYWNDLLSRQVPLTALDDFHSLSNLLVISEPLILFELNLPVDPHVGVHLPIC